MQLLSVVVPVYNSEKTIERCIRSILEQTYHNLEIIMVDDGSIDQSYRISKKFADRDERIKLQKNEHLGVTAARKAGVNMASGEYIAFVDSDDWVERDYFEKLMENMGDADVVITEHYVVEQDDRQKTCISSEHMKEGVYFGDRIGKVWEKAASPNGIDCCLWNKVCRTSLMKDSINKICDAIYLMEDYAISLQVLLMSNTIRIFNIQGYHYCVKKGSLVHSTHKDFLYNLHLLYTFMSNVVESHVYKEKLKLCFSQYMRYLISRSPWYLELETGREEMNLNIYYSHVYFPYYGRLKNKRLILYGAGYVGQAYYYHIVNDREAEIVAWVDKSYDKYKDFEENIISPEEITNLEFDHIIIAVWEEKTALEIRTELTEKGISEDIILWNKTKKVHSEL